MSGWAWLSDWELEEAKRCDCDLCGRLAAEGLVPGHALSYAVEPVDPVELFWKFLIGLLLGVLLGFAAAWMLLG